MSVRPPGDSPFELDSLIASVASLERVLGSDLALFGTLPSAPEDEDDPWKYSTGLAKLGPDGSVVSMRGSGGELVWPLRKAPGTAFPGQILVGRSASNDVRIDHASVSKLHCRFRRDGAQLFVSDAGSRNGTRLRSQTVRTEVTFSPGENIEIGDVRLRLLDLARLRARLTRRS